MIYICVFFDLFQGLCAPFVHVLSPQDSPQVSAHNALQVAGEFMSSLRFINDVLRFAGIFSLASFICLPSLSLSPLCLFHSH